MKLLTRLRTYLVAMLFAASVGGAATALIAPQPAVEAKCQQYVLTFPTWYRGLDPNCSGKFNVEVKTLVITIALNVVEMILQLVAYASVVFIIYGGFTYITSAGSADRIAAAKRTITNAIVGLVISMLAVTIVNVVVANITPGTEDAGVILAGILKTVYWLVGIVSVIVIIGAGIMYTTSGGDAQKVQQAKNAILYAVIGLLVVMFAFTITNVIMGGIAK